MERNTWLSVRKWTLRFLLVAGALAMFYLGILFYPTPLFAHADRIGRYRLYSDVPFPAGMSSVIEDVDRRVAAMEPAASGGSHRIYLCSSPRKYALFAYLTWKSDESLAIGLALPNETFVSMTCLRRFAEANRGVLRHTHFEGNLAEVVAHELAHFNSLRALGLRRHLAQPFWKSEGWAEFQANLAAARSDPDYDLHARIDQLLDDDFWANIPRVARRRWEAQLLVEFLGGVKGYELENLTRDDVTETSARAAMLEWHREGLSRQPGLTVPN